MGNCSEKSPGIIRILVRGRASIEARDNMGLTPLMVGAALHSTPAVNGLLELGAARMSFDAMGRSPLDHANVLRPARKALAWREDEGFPSTLVVKDAAATPRQKPLVTPRKDVLEVNDRESRDLPDIREKASPSHQHPQRKIHYLSWHTDVPRCMTNLPRWDHMGSTDVQRNILRAERVWRNRPCKELGVTVAERDRLHSAATALF